MQLGMIGLGRMGVNMVHRLLRGGHQCDDVRRADALKSRQIQRAVGISVCALSLSTRTHLCRKAVVGHATAVRWACRAACRRIAQ